MELEGTLSQLQTFGTWGKGILTTGANTSVQVVGEALVGLEEKQSYAMSGSASHHKQFGNQFKVEAVRMIVDKTSVINRLQSMYAGCGEKTARLLVAHFEEHQGGINRLWNVMTRRPWELENAETLCGKKLKYIGDEKFTPRARIFRTIEDRITSNQVDLFALEAVCAWLDAKAGDKPEGREERALELLLSDPYAAIGKADPYAFKDAEILGNGLGFPWNHPSRLAWVAIQAAKQAVAKGHSFATIAQFSWAVKSIEHRASAKQCLDEAIKRRMPVVLDDSRIYLKHIYDAEVLVADCFAGMISKGYPLWSGSLKGLLERIEHMESDIGTALDHSQRQALVGLLLSPCRLHTLTAGPGCGKTTVMEMVASLVPDVRFAASTGIAAKILANRVGKYGQVSQTVHAILEATGDSYGKNKDNPLIANLIVIDEAGMQDLLVCAALANAIPIGAHLLLVGDVNQLDSVSVGRVLADVVEMPEPDHHRLTVPHRSEKGILKLIEMINEGVIPEKEPDRSVAYVGFDSRAEISFETVKQLWLESVNSRGIAKVGLLFGHRHSSGGRFGMNVNQANTALQDQVNPATKDNRIHGSKLRLNDRIIVKRNVSLRRKLPNGREIVYAQLVNGDVGILKNVRRGDGGNLETAVLKMDDGRDIELPWMYSGKLDLSYAQTVHSAQGSEYEEVIFVVSGQGNEFLNRRLLYTGCSRAKQMLTIVGKRNEVCSVAAHMAQMRQSWLPMRIQESKEYK